MGRKITPVERIRAKTMSLAMRAFRTDPSLGKCNARNLLNEIYTHLKSGMDEEQIVQEVVKSHTTVAPQGQLSLM